MKIDQICKECGKVFQRSLCHPQIVTCPECRSGKESIPCVFCERSQKRGWSLFCTKHNKDVTESRSCKDLIKTSSYKEIEQELKEIGNGSC